MRKMLINATEPEETRIAITKDNKLFDLDIENVDHEQKKANIYKAKISRIEPSLNAIFVSYGEEKNGFLPFKEVSPEYFSRPHDENDDNPPMQELLKVGQEIIVQINKEERGTKGAALTTFITLAGCYLVLMPNNPQAGGISRRIEGEERQKLKALMNALSIPEEMGIIIRTAGVDRTPEEIQWDLDVLLKLWETIQTATSDKPAPFLIHRESDIMIRAIRDYLREDIIEIIIDTKECYEDVKRQLTLLRPDFVERLVHFEGSTPLFSKMEIESQIESAYQREVKLPSGGSIVIDATEALTAIDVNSAKATRRDNIEETAFHTNIEAAEEVARQMKLRDIGGLIIIDFIDMSSSQNQKKVEEILSTILQHDRAKIQMTRISRFGLVEISRQRMRPSLGESNTMACPRCEGQGIIRSTPSLGLSILRLIEEEALKDKTNEVRVQLPVSVATFLLNEKRQSINELEYKLQCKIVLIPNSNLETPHYNIQRIYGEVYNASRPSFDLIEQKNDQAEAYTPKKAPAKQQAAVKSQVVAAPQKNTGTEGMFTKFIKSIFSAEKDTTKDKKPAQKTQQKQANTNQRNDNRNDRNRNQNAQGQRNRNDRNQNNRRDDNRGERKDSRDNRNDRNRNQNAQGQNQRNKGPQQRRNQPNKQDNQGKRSNIHRSEEVIDISALKEKSQAEAAAKAPKPTPVAEVAPVQTKPVIVNPQDKISPMVKDVLEKCQTLATDNAKQVETKVKSTDAPKYIKPVIVELSLDALKKEQAEEVAKKEARRLENEAKRKAKREAEKRAKLDAEAATKAAAAKEKSETPETAPTLQHNAAANPEQQAYVSTEETAQQVETIVIETAESIPTVEEATPVFVVEENQTQEPVTAEATQEGNAEGDKPSNTKRTISPFPRRPATPTKFDEQSD
jgi:ribonuclease E